MVELAAGKEGELRCGVVSDLPPTNLAVLSWTPDRSGHRESGEAEMEVLEQSWELPFTTSDGQTLSDTVRRLLRLRGLRSPCPRLALENSTPRRAHPSL